MTNPNAATVERYIEFWNASSPLEQRRLAACTFAEQVEYSALPGVLTGAEALIDFHDQFVEHLGSAAFRAREEPEFHHDRARLKWEIIVGKNTSFAAGTDVMVFDPDGRIRSVTAFLDRAPEGFDPEAHAH